MDPSDSNRPQRTRSSGRKKIPMQKIENKNALRVTFSKRRHGLFKKASEISVLCGAQVFIVVFSPGEKPYSFSSCSSSSSSSSSAALASSSSSFIDVELLQQQLNQMQHQQQQQQQQQQQRELWWEEAAIEEMGLEELKGFGERLQKKLSGGAVVGELLDS